MNSMKGVSNTSIAYGLSVASIADARNTGRDGEKTASAAVAGRGADSSVLDSRSAVSSVRVRVPAPERDVPRDDSAVEVEGEGVARRQRDAAEPGADRSAVLDARRDEGREAAFGHGDRAPVDRRAARVPGNIEVEAAGHEIFVLDAGRRCERAARVHPGARPEKDAARVDEEYPAVGGKPPENEGLGAARDPVQRDRGRGGLPEVRVLINGDGERTPERAAPAARRKRSAVSGGRGRA